MKLTKSKQFLSDAINASGKGWPDGAIWAVQVSRPPEIFFASGREKPVKSGNGYRVKSGGLFQLDSTIKCDKLSPNWHQTCLSREEYFSAYPAEPVADADGWIEWKGEVCPVKRSTLVDVRFSGGSENIGVSAMTESWHEDHVKGSNEKLVAMNWNSGLSIGGITAYRLHKPVPAEKLSPEAVMDAKSALMGESIESCVRKPTIERLAADHRNKLDYANRKQQEADEAKADAEAKLAELVEAGKALGIDISPNHRKARAGAGDYRLAGFASW